jgi:hypothetical protein
MVFERRVSIVLEVAAPALIRQVVAVLRFFRRHRLVNEMTIHTQQIESGRPPIITPAQSKQLMTLLETLIRLCLKS